MTPRCENCQFWKREELQEERLRDDPHHDDNLGQCCRNAPVPRDQWAGALKEALGLIAWAVEEMAKVEHQADRAGGKLIAEVYDDGDRDRFNIYEWPFTTAASWCGEFKERG